MHWKRTAVGAALGGTCRGDSRVVLLLARLVASDGLLDILECQKHLLGIEPLRTPAELRTSQLPQQVPQPINLRQRAVTLGERGVTLRTRRRNQRMQRFDVGRKLICNLAHADTESNSHLFVRRDELPRFTWSQVSRCCRRPRNVARLQTPPVHPINEHSEL